MSNTRTLNVERSTSTAHRLLHYDGACNNLHGHNMEWEIELEVSMIGVGESNMPLDFKAVADQIDVVDHATVLNEDDPLLESTEALGEYITTDGDPTCEVLSWWMAEQIYELDDDIEWVEVSLAETDKYTATAKYDIFTRMEKEGND